MPAAGSMYHSDHINHIAHSPEVQPTAKRIDWSWAISLHSGPMPAYHEP